MGENGRVWSKISNSLVSGGAVRAGPDVQGKLNVTSKMGMLYYGGIVSAPGQCEYLLGALCSAAVEKGYGVEAAYAASCHGADGVGDLVIGFSLLSAGSGVRLYVSRALHMHGEKPELWSIRSRRSFDAAKEVAVGAGARVYRYMGKTVVLEHEGLTEFERERMARARQAYEAFSHSNAGVVQEAFERMGGGKKYWFSHVSDAGALVDYFRSRDSPGVSCVTFQAPPSDKAAAQAIAAALEKGQGLGLVVLRIPSPFDMRGLGSVLALSEKITGGGLGAHLHTSAGSATGHRRTCRCDALGANIGALEPTLFVFADFTPDLPVMESQSWVVVLPSAPRGISHMLVPGPALRQMDIIASHAPHPMPNVCVTQEIINALSTFENDSVGRDLGLAPIARAGQVLFNQLSPRMQRLYYERGYRPIIYTVNVTRLSRRPLLVDLSNLFANRHTLKHVNPWLPEQAIGHHCRIGNLIIVSEPLGSEDPALEGEEGVVLGPESIRAIAKELGINAPRASETIPLLPDRPFTQAPPSDAGAQRAQAAGAPGAASAEAAVGAWLSKVYGEPMELTKISTPSPAGPIVSEGFGGETEGIVAFVDRKVPPEGQEYVTLYWVGRGYSVFRVRADDIESGRAEMPPPDLAVYPPLTFVAADPEASWGDFKSRIEHYQREFPAGAHERWYQDRTATQQGPDAGLRWAVYCAAGSRGGGASGFHDPEGSLDEVASQKKACFGYASSRGLCPNKEFYFEDLCPADTPLEARPGLMALVRSGATGLLCAGRAVLSSAGAQDLLSSLGLRLAWAS